MRNSQLKYFLIWLLSAILTVFGVISLAENFAPIRAKPVAWIVPSLAKVGQQDSPGKNTKVQLYAARGEYESFQIAIRAPIGTLRDVNVKVSNLVAAKNQIIPKNNITLYREQYVKVDPGSPKSPERKNKPLPTGWYADPLIPFVDPQTRRDIQGASLDAHPFNIKSRSNEVIWVDVFVPRDAQPGNYKGRYTITTQRSTIRGEIALKVWDFTLPLQPSLHSSFLIWTRKDAASLAELVKHKVMPSAVMDGQLQKELTQSLGLSSYRIPFWSGADYHNCSMKPAPSVEEIKRSAAPYDKNILLYVYAVDEVEKCPNLIEPIKEWSRNIHAAGLKHLAVLAPLRELFNNDKGKSFVDIWVVQPMIYEEYKPQIAEALAKGDEVWFYTGLQREYSPKWQIDFAPINYRVAPYILQNLGLTGILYWQVDLWNKDVWHNADNYIRSDGKHFPGEGLLVYPGQEVGIKGVAPSIRLKIIREGVEDYEYVELLKKLGRGAWAMPKVRQIGSYWDKWSQNPQQLENTRKQFGEEIERLDRQKNLNLPK